MLTTQPVPPENSVQPTSLQTNCKAMDSRSFRLKFKDARRAHAASTLPTAPDLTTLVAAPSAEIIRTPEMNEISAVLNDYLTNPNPNLQRRPVRHTSPVSEVLTGAIDSDSGLNASIVLSLFALCSRTRICTIRNFVAQSQGRTLLYATNLQPSISASKQTVCLTSEPAHGFPAQPKKPTRIA